MARLTSYYLLWMRELGEKRWRMWELAPSIRSCKDVKGKVSCHSITRNNPTDGTIIGALCPACEKALQHMFGRWLFLEELAFMGAFVWATTTIAGRVHVVGTFLIHGAIVESGPAFWECPPPMSCSHPKAWDKGYDRRMGELFPS
jgi:hypothetical protein